MYNLLTEASWNIVYGKNENVVWHFPVAYILLYSQPWMDYQAGPPDTGPEVPLRWKSTNYCEEQND